MSKTILFSPVGGTDPISLANCRDGSLLHICRVYKPEQVILYMSYEVLENQKKDNRYLYCLDQLSKLQNRKMNYRLIKRPELKEVQEFDFFYHEFRGIIAEIFREMDKSDTLLLNVSSGTPAMKSALLVLRTLGEFTCKLIQVSTPERKMNENIHQGYDVATLWELNEDNQDNFENRCREVWCPTLSALKNEEIIKKHIMVYDYSAAITVAKTMPLEYTERYLDLLFLAHDRQILDLKNVDQIRRKLNYDPLPIHEGNGMKCFEYALIVDLKLRRGEYADFMRAITPLLVDLLDLVLKKQCKISIKDHCRKNPKKGNALEWDKKKLADTKIVEALYERYGMDFKYGSVKSEDLVTLIKKFSADMRLIQLAENIRSIEVSVRNLAAHQIISITDVMIKALTGFTGIQIMNQIKELFSYTGIKIGPDDWNSYDKMNQQIIDAIARNSNGAA